MVITRQEMADWHKSGSKEPIAKWVKNNTIIDVEVENNTPAIDKPKSDRQKAMDKLDELGIEYKKNSKTADLIKLAEESE